MMLDYMEDRIEQVGLRGTCHEKLVFEKLDEMDKVGFFGEVVPAG